MGVKVHHFHDKYGVMNFNPTKISHMLTILHLVVVLLQLQLTYYLNYQIELRNETLRNETSLCILVKQPQVLRYDGDIILYGHDTAISKMKLGIHNYA